MSFNFPVSSACLITVVQTLFDNGCRLTDTICPHSDITTKLAETNEANNWNYSGHTDNWHHYPRDDTLLRLPSPQREEHRLMTLYVFARWVQLLTACKSYFIFHAPSTFLFFSLPLVIPFLLFFVIVYLYFFSTLYKLVFLEHMNWLQW